MLSGGLTDEYYLGLPYSDASRQNPAQWSMRARSFDCMLRRVLKPGVPVGARILDLGAGNCWLSYRLALADYQPFAIDLLTNDADGLGAAEHYREYLPEFFPRIRAEFAHLPFQPDQFHAAIFNASFHYAEDFETTLREALRCCRQNGIVIICDSPWFQDNENGAKTVADQHRQIVQSLGATAEVHHGSEYLTDQFLRQLENRLQIRWTVHTPKRTFGAAIEPWIARLRRRPEPPRFRIYVARKTSL
jgi:SAM-dependent methyltransferase